MESALQATLYQPGSAAGCPARVSLDASGLEIVAADGQRQVCERTRLTVPEYIPGAPLTVRLPAGQTLEIPDGRLARQLAAPGGRRLARVERSLLLLAALLLIASAVPYALHKLALPALTPKIAQRLATADIEKWEDDIFIKLLQTKFFEILEGDEHIHSRTLLASQGARLAEAVKEREFSYEFMLISAKHFGANAFALPGGRVLVTEELIELLDEDQLAGVLGHEIAHIELRHSLDALIRSSVFGGLLMLIMGDIWSVALPSALSDLAYSRENELAADCRSAEYLRAAGMDPEIVGSALESLMADAPSFYKYFSTHPNLDVRKENIIRCARAGESG